MPPSPEPAAAEQSVTHQRLSGSLGVSSITFMVIAAAAPLTVLGGNVPLAVGLGNGPGAPIGFGIAAVILLIFAVGFVTMTPYVGEAGAFFSYVTAGLGNRLGLGTAFVALIAYTAIQVGVYGYVGWAIDDFVAYAGGPHISWWIYSFAMIALVAILGYRHIDLSAKVLGVALVCEIGIVLILDAVVVISGGDGGWGAKGLHTGTFSADNIFTPTIGIAVLFALTGFIGFEATAVFRDEARDPGRTIPRATYLAVTIIGVFYAVSCWAIIAGVGGHHAVDAAKKTLDGSANLLLDTGERYLGAVGRDIMQVLLLTSLFACVLSFHNVIARYQFTLANKAVLPAVLATRHPRHHSPSASSVVQTVTATIVLAVLVLIGLDPLVGVFGSMAGVSTVGMVLLMLTTSIAVFVYFARNPQLGGKLFTTRIAPVAAVLGLLAATYLVLSNFTLVTGGSFGLSATLAAIPLIALVLGVLAGGRFDLTPTTVTGGGE
ncbi:MAG: APC family permease [Gordonia sp. (in: high G+C Gram-positive bacteria)]